MSTGAPRGAGITGLWMAQRRAEETRRPDRLFDDPLAGAFVTAAGSAAPPSWAGPGAMRDYFAVRTRFFDDYLLAAAGAGCRQVVILAAGLDARAFRLRWPAGVRLFEIDQPDVLAFKEGVLAERGSRPACERVALAADLRQDWQTPLRQAGFQPAEPAAWLAEGILMYLTAAEGDALLSAATGLAATGGQLALEHARSGGSAGPPVFGAALVALARIGARWRSAVDDPVPWLASRGWSGEAHDPRVLAAAYGRNIPSYVTGWLVRAVRA